MVRFCHCINQWVLLKIAAENSVFLFSVAFYAIFSIFPDDNGTRRESAKAEKGTVGCGCS